MPVGDRLAEKLRDVGQLGELGLSGVGGAELTVSLDPPQAAPQACPRIAGGRGDVQHALGQPALTAQSPEQLAGLIATAAGVVGLRPRIERISTFSFAAQIASCYRERRGFVLGDAAHRMTPRGGTGMNTAIHDAYDLAWKLAWVSKHWAEPSLLDTYQAERRPVGLHNVTRSADPNGLRQTAEQALPWDLNGRIPHHWLRHRDRSISTLDLLSDGLTVITGELAKARRTASQRRPS
jgi:putative polyketide hydroxylase